MAATYPIQSSFAAGEVTNLLYGRFDTPGYQQGLKECTNATVDSRGPVSRRVGFKHQFSMVAGDAKLFNFDHTRDLPFLVMFTDDLVTVSASSAGGLGQELLRNTDFTEDGVLTPWIDLSAGVGSVDVAGGSCLLDPGKGSAVNNYAMISQVIVIETPGDYKFRMAGNFTGPVGAEWEVRLGSTPGGAEYQTDQIPANDTYIEIDYTGVGAETAYLSVYAPGWGVGGNPVTVGNIDAMSFRSIIPAQALVELPSPYSESELAALRAQMSPTGNYMVITHSNYAPYVLVYDPIQDLWTFGLWGMTNPPASWSVPSGNFPTTMCFFQGRSWWGGCANVPESLWASMSGVYFDMSIGVNPDDALQFIIAEHGQIMWLEAGKNLLVGTVLREFIINSVDGVITPSDVQVEQQSTYGSAPVQPVQMNNETLFVSALATKVRSLWYQWTESGYLARELTYTNNQIVGAGIRNITYMRDPIEYIWFTLRNGDLIGCTYHKDGNDKPVYGWHKHKIPQGLVLDVEVLYRGDEVNIAAAVLVDKGGVSEVHVVNQVFQVKDSTGESNPTALDAAIFLDDYVSVNISGGILDVTGLDHLEGKEVVPMVDGAVQTPKTVVGGQITLDSPGNFCHVGLPYTTKVATLPLVTGGPGGGSTASYQKGRNKIYARMLGSALPKINGQRGAERHPSTPMNTGEPAISQDVFITNLGWDEFASIVFEQELPFPMAIVSIFGQTEIETL